MYAQAPNGYRDETRECPPMRELIEGQIERFAPGFSDTILARNVLTPADLEEYNPNYRGGDIAAGALGPARPRRTRNVQSRSRPPSPPRPLR